MASFDIILFYTNFPVKETVNINLNLAFNNNIKYCPFTQKQSSYFLLTQSKYFSSTDEYKGDLIENLKNIRVITGNLTIEKTTLTSIFDFLPNLHEIHGDVNEFETNKTK